MVNHVSVGGFVTRALMELEEASPELWNATNQNRITAVKFFHTLHGDMMMGEIDDSHVTSIIDELSVRPSRPRRVRKAVDLHHDYSVAKQSAPKLSANRIRIYIRSLADVWDILHACDHTASVNRNPFLGHVLPASPLWRSVGLSVHEIERIFALSVFTRRDRPSAWVGEACYWVPLLLLSTGARPEDVVRLTPSDFRDDLPAFGRTSLTVRRAENMTGDRKLRTGRLFSATRTFPVPKLLIDLGITDYVAWLRKRGQSELFADLKPKGPKKERFPGFEMWWEGYLRASDAFPSGCRPARAFQKTWVTQACRCGITLNAQDYILGRKLPEHSQTASGESLLGNEILKLDKLNYAFSGILKWTHV